MTFVELIRLLMQRAPLNEVEQRDANSLLDELERLNAFGTVLGNTQMQEHVCTPDNRYGFNGTRCGQCGKDLQNV